MIHGSKLAKGKRYTKDGDLFRFEGFEVIQGRTPRQDKVYARFPEVGHYRTLLVPVQPGTFEFDIQPQED